MLKKLEKLFFYLFIFSLPFQTRVILYQWPALGEIAGGKGVFNEWSSAFLYLTDILFFAVLLLWFWQNKARRFFKNFKLSIGNWLRNYIFWLIIFIVIGFISLAGAGNLYLGLYQWFKLLEFIILFFYLRHMLYADRPDEEFPDYEKAQTKINLRHLVYVFIFSGLVQSYIAVRQYANQKSLGLKYLAESPLAIGKAGVANFTVDAFKIIRPYGALPHPNVLAAFLLAGIFFLYFIWTTKKHSFAKNCFLMIAYAVFLFALFLTFSRVIIFVFLLISLAYFILVFRRARKDQDRSLIKRTIFIFFTLFVLCLVFCFLAKPEIASRFKVSSNESAFSLRAFYNNNALITIADYPLMGLGMGNSVWQLRNMYHLMAGWFHQPVHNIYLLIASESGLISLVIFLFFIFLLSKDIWKNKQKNYLLVINCYALLVAFLIIGLFDHFFWTLQQGQLMFWLVLGIAAAYGNS